MPASNLPLLAEFLDESDVLESKFFLIDELCLLGDDLISDCDVEGLYESPSDNYLIEIDTMDTLVYTGGVDELIQVCEVEGNGV